MAFITISGEPGCRAMELARVSAQRLGCELLAEQDLARMFAAEFGDSIVIPDQAWRPMVVSILAGLGAKAHIVVSSPGSEMFSRDLPSVLRFHLVAPESIRLDNLMRDHRLDRAEAKVRLRKMADAQALARKVRFGEKLSRPTDFDLMLNAQKLSL